MKKNVSRVLAFLLVFALCFGLVGCNFKGCKKDTKKTESKTSSQSQTSDETPSDDNSSTDDTGNIDEPTDSDPTYTVVVERPLTDGAISRGEKMEYKGIDIDPDDPGEDINDDDINDIDDNEKKYSDEPYVMMYGKKASGATRAITVDNRESGVLFDNILGVGCNFYPTYWNYTTQLGSTQFNFGYAGEISAKRYNDIHGAYGRSWFQIDWMMTDDAGDDYEKYENDWESNPDYKNYYAGKYDFNNEHFRSCIRYWKMLDEAGTDIEVSFGWKIATRLQSWFTAEPSRARMGAPRDIKQYADAAAAMYKYCYYEAGLKNVNTITFYNEPARVEDATWRSTWDFATIGDKRVYWAAMMQEVYNVFHNQSKSAYVKGGKGGDPDGWLKKVQIWGAENSDGMNIIDEKYVTQYLNINHSEIFDAFSLHGYFGYGSRYNAYVDGDPKGDAYKGVCKIFAMCNRFYKKPMYVTEYYCADKDLISDKQYAWNSKNPENTGWTNSYSAYFIAASNNGCRLQLDWSFTGGYLPDPIGFDPAGGDTAAWYTPGTEANVNKIMYKYYLYAMRNNYIPRGASSHKIEWTGDDIRASAFTKGNDFALYVEANEDSVNRTLKVNLKKALGNRDLYVYVFDYNIKKDANATIPVARDVIRADRSFSYNINGDYGVYLFSTVKPLKQVGVFTEDGTTESVTSHLLKDQTLKLKAQLTDCDASDVVQWKISSYSDVIVYDKKVPRKQTERKLDGTADIGTVSQNAKGTEISYTPAANAKAGDVITLRGTIKGTNRFTVAIITIV